MDFEDLEVCVGNLSWPVSNSVSGEKCMNMSTVNHRSFLNVSVVFKPSNSLCHVCLKM